MTVRTASIGTDLQEYSLRRHADEVEGVLADLPSLEKQVLRMRFGLGGRRHSQRDTARRLAITVGRVRRVERRAIRTLRILSLPPDLALRAPHRSHPGADPVSRSGEVNRTMVPRTVEVPPGLVPPSRRSGDTNR